MYAGTKGIIVLLLAAVSTARPQYNYNQASSQSSGRGTYGGGGGPLSVVCALEETGPGQYKYNCAGVDQKLITLSSEHILWLKGPDGGSQQLDVVIPNYRVEELIRAAVKAGGKAGATNINILLKKPETIYDVQAQDGAEVVASKPVVNLQYEAVDRPTSLHYPGDKPYNPLTGPIREPGAAPAPGPY